jgi:uncharacterized RDD family membrane protein YckC
MLRQVTSEDPAQRHRPAGEPPRARSLPARLFGFGARGAQRAAGATGIDRVAEAAAEEAIVRAVESPAVERALARVLSGPVVQEAAESALNSPAVERALVEALDSEMVDRIWERLLSSDETQKLIERIAEAPELRAAVAAQGVGLLDDLGDELSDLTSRLDDVLEAVVWRLTGRRRRVTEAPQAGVMTRLVAFAIDVGLLNAFFFIMSALLGLVVSGLFFDDGITSLGIVLGGAVWVVAGGLYLVGFWALEGQTPGMRFLNIRLDAHGSRRIGFPVAIRRWLGFILCVLTLGLGFLGILFAQRRRGLHDRIADTEVIYVSEADWAPWSQLKRRTPLRRPSEAGA